MASSEGEANQIVELEKESEVRLEVEDKVATLKLLAGTAEVFGIELVTNRVYVFKNAKIAVYTWYGCKVEIDNHWEHHYTSSETPMASYANAHSQLEILREKALASESPDAWGPRVLIAGPVDTGKSSFARVLLAYTARLGRSPGFIDLDVGLGDLALPPGCISASILDKTCLSVEEGLKPSTSLVYFLGRTAFSEDSSKNALSDYFTTILRSLTASIKQRGQHDASFRTSGFVVNLPGTTENKQIQGIIKEMEIDFVFVMGSDKLFADMQKWQASIKSQAEADSGVAKVPSIVKLRREGDGVAGREAKYRRQLRHMKIREYYYGAGHIHKAQAQKLIGHNSAILSHEHEFNPVKIALKLSDYHIYNVQELSLSSQLMPVGQEQPQFDTLSLTRIKPNGDLNHLLLAVVHLPGPHKNLEDIPKEVLTSNVAGFVYVQEINLEEQIMTVLAPCPISIPSSYLMAGTIKWIEE